MKDTLLIVNPASGGGATGRMWPRLERELRGQGLVFDTALTRRPAEAVQLAREASEMGRTLVVACGGDGTINEVVNGLLGAADREPGGTRLGVLPLGTGGDFRRTFGVPAEPVAAAAMFRDCAVRRIDAGLVRYRTTLGSSASTHFVNIADAGIGGDVVHRVNGGFRLLGGGVTFMLASAVSLARWRNRPMTVTIDGETRELVAQQVVVANCQYFGGGMRMAPGAEPDDGLFDVILVGDVSALENVRGLARIRSGTHLEAGNPKMSVVRGRHVEVESPARVRLDVDGEGPGVLPASFQILPGAIDLVVPSGAAGA